ncbi:MAG: hypothetical protein HY318_00070 [Armatimonadetes bacterium]|nr:hypothetical protein [Armatimonadota bacterium]
MKPGNSIGIVLLILTCLTVGYAAGKIKSGQEAKEKLFNVLETMNKTDDLSDKQAVKLMNDLNDVSQYLWNKVLSSPDKLNEQDLAVLCANEAMQVALTMGMVGETDLFKDAVKKVGETDSPKVQAVSESMGTVAGYLLAVADPQMWDQRMGAH